MVRSYLYSLVLAALFLTGCGAPSAPANVAPPVVQTGSTTNTPPVVQEDVFCTEEYAPVCGMTPVDCNIAPCDPAEQTFPNRCYAQKAGATDIQEGACAF